MTQSNKCLAYGISVGEGQEWVRGRRDVPATRAMKAVSQKRRSRIEMHSMVHVGFRR